MEECSTPNSPVFIVYFVLFLCLLQIPAATAATPENAPAFNEAEVKARLESLDKEFLDYRYNTAVRNYVKRYVTGRKGSEYILGRTVMYFPIFERYLEEAGLPESLKYLPIIESTLNPKARSRVGAVGLWQFMPATGREYGLKIGRYVDERVDPIKSSKAAAQFLTKEYKRFGDWALVLAAYNSGSGRVSRAIKRARTKDYWRLQRYLPSETRNYVPRFIAATYLVEFFDKHDLQPDYPSLDLQLTETIEIYDYCSFFRIAELTGIPLDIIEKLNPAYEQGFIPSNSDGNFVTLPSRVMPYFREYVETQRPDNIIDMAMLQVPIMIAKPVDAGTAYEQSTYTSKEGQTLQSIAKELNCTAYQLRLWNRLSNEKIEPGSQLIVYKLRDTKKRRKELPRKVVEIKTIPGNPIKTIAEAPSLLSPDIAPPIREEYVYYTAKRRIKLSEVAKDYGIPHEDLLKLNGWVIDKILRPGDQARIKRMQLGDKVTR